MPAPNRGARTMATFSTQSRLWPILALVMTLLSLVLVAVLIGVLVSGRADEQPGTCGQGENVNDYVIDIGEPSEPGPFHDLTTKEMRNLRTFLENEPSIMALKVGNDVGGVMPLNTTYIAMMDLFPPKKSEVLAYLDEGGPQPVRQAVVVLFRGNLDPPVVEERICGPLPTVDKCELSVSDRKRNPIEFSLRPFNIMEMQAIRKGPLSTVDKEIGYILRASYGTSYGDCKDCFNFFTTPVGTALQRDINKRSMWIWAYYPVEYYLIHPVDFGVLVSVDGSDASQFRVDKIWYAGQIYNSLDELITGYNSSSIPTSHRSMPTSNRELFSTLNRRGPPMPPKPQRPPTQIEPDGKRYSLKKRQVEYMGWKFNFRMSTVTGPMLYDVRFKRERIVYELALQEIIVFYSGDNPLQRLTDVVDSAGFTGTMAKSLVPGGDCPESATFISNTLPGQLRQEPATYTNVFCLFEQNDGIPLRRHIGYRYVHGSFYGGMLDSYLTLRTIMSIGNYDYIIDFMFHQNGVIDTRVSSTGFLMVSPYSTTERPYGFRIEDHIIGNIHHHMFNFKVDLDIAGTSNRYETLDIDTEEVELRTIPGVKYYQTKISPNLKNTEKEALYKFNFEKPRYHVVHNGANRTKYDEVKAYRIAMDGLSPQLLPENKGNEATIPWARHQLVVTKHKDNEQVSSSPYAMWDSLNPVINFTQFYEDDENIKDQDLVFWLTLGLQHIPHSEDLPVTSTAGTRLSFSLLPFNYFPECPSMGSRDAIRMEHKNPDSPAEGIVVDRYGNSKESCSVPRSKYEDELKDDPDIGLETLENRGVL